MAYNDLREWIATLEREGELARVKTEVDWDFEIGAIARENMDRGGPALLFENIKDYKNYNMQKAFYLLPFNLFKNCPYARAAKRYAI